MSKQDTTIVEDIVDDVAQVDIDDDEDDDDFPDPPPDQLYFPDDLLTNKGKRIIFNVIIYGSKPGDPLNDERFGEHQRRCELTLYPRLPHNRMTKDEITSFAKQFLFYQWPDFKHTQFWHCEICDKPTRISQTTTMSWTRLDPPRVLSYIHFCCDIREGKCAETLREMEIARRAMTPGAPPTPPVFEPDTHWYPFASSCAGCQEDTSSRPNLSHCGGCKLTRYCSETCQRADWRRHKPFCKTKKTVKWIWD
ncbi:hypothetical protein SCHPADRAFT_846040 [Schizopora paradoxa]|uniref:MYND-type domain-containing protein n=1 Tax=Schizopora paradoxa TaxID=27342 RepID=A0A0H2SKZ6_9AGAM|nr:hypothetical protein SCHPADRAFT_846040 [Schizopora paradoxa]